MTIGGVYGIVRRLQGDEIVLEVAENTLVRFSRQAISKRIDPEPAETQEPESQPAELPEADSP